MTHSAARSRLFCPDLLLDHGGLRPGHGLVVRDGRLVRVREEEIAARVERLRARQELWR